MLCLPGELLVYEGRLLLIADGPRVVDLDSGEPLTLSQLLCTFAEDPTQPGPIHVKITIEPIRLRSA